MRSDNSRVDWYHHCIQEKRRRATTLTIEIGLNAQDEDDASALAQTIERLDSAIEILEQADAIAVAASNAADEPLMDDLGHSMAPLNFAGRDAGDNRGYLMAPFNFVERLMSAAASRDALQFFA